MLSVPGMDPALTREEREPSGSLAQLCGGLHCPSFCTSGLRGCGIWLGVNAGLMLKKDKILR